jgi:hypothetical protein
MNNEVDLTGGEGTWAILKTFKKNVGRNHSKMRYKKGKKSIVNITLAS